MFSLSREKLYLKSKNLELTYLRADLRKSHFTDLGYAKAPLKRVELNPFTCLFQVREIYSTNN